MPRQFIFKNLATGRQITLPVTPSAYTIAHSMELSVENMHGVGEVVMGGNRKADSYSLEFMLPVRKYPFNLPGTNLNPFVYIEFFQVAANAKHTLQYMISDTPVLATVLVENITYGEKDGSGDVYCTLTLRRQVQIAGGANDTAALARKTEATQGQEVRQYRVVQNDTLSAICRKVYGNANLYGKVAAYNGIKNPHLIYPGQLIKLPPAERL